jgi:hypothetical protein
VRKDGEAVGETLREIVSGLLHIPNMAQQGVGAKEKKLTVGVVCFRVGFVSMA